MLPDLGKYAEPVLLAYGLSLALIAGLVIWSVLQGRRARAEMDAMEQRTRADG